MHNMRYKCRICRICRIRKPGLLCPLYSSSTETKAHACFYIPLGFNREQQKQFPELDIINSELKSTSGDSRRADEHPVLAVGLLQFLWCHPSRRHDRPTRNAHLTRMFYIHNPEGCLEANVPPLGPRMVLDFCRRSVSNIAMLCKPIC